ncbi:hypothetical protein ACVW0K_007410 [Streptomyces filamentosus]
MPAKNLNSAAAGLPAHLARAIAAAARNAKALKPKK